MRGFIGVFVAVVIGVAAPVASADVVLNEVNCEGTDWVELVNTSGDAAEISGWLLTDDPLNPPEPRPDHRMLFPDPTVIGPSGTLVVERTTDFPFGISCDDTIRLADEAEELVDETTFGEHTVPTDTWGRYPNGTGPFMPTLATQGTPNEPSSGGGGPGPDLAAWMFEPDMVVEIDLELPQESIDALALTPEEYQDASFSLSTTGGSYGPFQIGVRLKGNGSFRTLDGKAAFKLKFSHSVPGQRFLGLKALTLNNLVQDQSMVHEVLTYDLFRAVGVAAPRAGYAYVRVNAEDYGLYLNLETPDEVMLSRWFDTTQHLYEGGFTADVTPAGLAAFEVDEGSESDQSDLAALVAAAGEEGGDWSEQISPLLDLEQATAMWAVEQYVGHWDGYSPDSTSPNKPANFFLHSDLDGRFSMLPWGTDQTLDRRIAFDSPWGLLFRRCLGDLSCRELYLDALRQVGATAAGLDLDALAASTAVQLQPWQQLDPRREYSLAQIEAAVAATRAFIAARPFDLEGFFNPQVGSGLAPSPVLLPRTSITARPRARTRAARVRFKFKSSVAGSSFVCKLDRERFAPCDSPAVYAVEQGRHRFLVSAVGADGRADPSAARAHFRVMPPR